MRTITSASRRLTRATLSALLPAAQVPESQAPLTRLGALLPAVQVAALLVGERVDLDAERLELQPGDLAVDRLGHRVDAGRERVAVLDEVLEAERLAGEVDVHHRSRMTLPRRQVH